MGVAMTVELSLTRLAGAESSERLLVVGPSLGTSVALLWRDCALTLDEQFEVIGWDLPGHGSGAPATEPFSVEDIADDLSARVAMVASMVPPFQLVRFCTFSEAVEPGAIAAALRAALVHPRQGSGVPADRQRLHAR